MSVKGRRNGLFQGDLVETSIEDVLDASVRVNTGG